MKRSSLQSLSSPGRLFLVGGLFGSVLCVQQGHAQTADIELVALTAPSASDATVTLPTSESHFLNSAAFFVEVWAQATDVNGLSSVSADLSFGPTLANVTAITHTSTFNVLTQGAIDNVVGTIDDLSGSHLGPCTDGIGVATNWARVATLDVTALASGVLTFQSAATGSAIYNTSICGAGDIADAQIAFGSVTVNMVECLSDLDCDDGLFCNGAETCDLVAFTCQTGTAPTCDDLIDCTDDICDPAAGGGAGACVNSPNDGNCGDSIDCTIDACDQLGAPGTGCSNVANDANCTDAIDCTIDTCDQLAGPGAGCSYTPDHTFCEDPVPCTVDLCDQLAAPGVGCSNTPSDALCENSLFCDGFETCDAIQGCLAGAPPCTAECEHCLEDTDLCGWCVFDLDGSSVMGTGDFSLFAPCFGACYPSGDPCFDSNFNEDTSGCVGTADFAAFVGCFGATCGACSGCSGSGGGSLAFAATSSYRYESERIHVRVVPRSSASPDDILRSTPIADRRFSVGDDVFVEIWARTQTDSHTVTAGLASAYVDLRFDGRLHAVEVLPSGEFGLFAGESSRPSRGVLRAVGGCRDLGSLATASDGNWVRVATVVARATRPGTATVAAELSDQLHGFSHVGDFQNIDPSLIEFENATVTIGKRHRAMNR